MQANAVSYNTVIDACVKHCDVDKAEAWLWRMLRDGVQADVVSYSTVIDLSFSGEPVCLRTFFSTKRTAVANVP